MNALSLTEINQSSPYEVYWHEKSHTYRFKSDYGVILAIAFDEDDIIESAKSYMLSIINVNNTPSPRDLKIRDTTLLIIEQFFKKNQAALLYICEGCDGRQQMRNRLFEFWFSTYRMRNEYMLMPVSLIDMEGIDNFAALIIKKDNPNFIDIVSEFSNTIAMFQVKPAN